MNTLRILAVSVMLIMFIGFTGLSEVGAASDEKPIAGIISIAIFAEIEGRGKAEIQDKIYPDDRLLVHPNGIIKLRLVNSGEIELFGGVHQIVKKINPSDKVEYLYLVSLGLNQNGEIILPTSDKVQIAVDLNGHDDSRDPDDFITFTVATTFGKIILFTSDKGQIPDDVITFAVASSHMKPEPDNGFAILLGAMGSSFVSPNIEIQKAASTVYITPANPNLAPAPTVAPLQGAPAPTVSTANDVAPTVTVLPKTFTILPAPAPAPVPAPPAAIPGPPVAPPVPVAPPIIVDLPPPPVSPPIIVDLPSTPVFSR